MPCTVMFYVKGKMRLSNLFTQCVKLKIKFEIKSMSSFLNPDRQLEEVLVISCTKTPSNAFFIIAYTFPMRAFRFITSVKINIGLRPT